MAKSLHGRAFNECRFASDQKSIDSPRLVQEYCNCCTTYPPSKYSFLKIHLNSEIINLHISPESRIPIAFAKYQFYTKI